MKTYTVPLKASFRIFLDLQDRASQNVVSLATIDVVDNTVTRRLPLNSAVASELSLLK